ncbi:uncharacterized protein MELLADRAFT_68704 [Melampsora larici-populina 98AG31]|uniref:SET domain-containing protein n=1 Tax=Melampsora larici-populina (strain 98AG31 / pathotype 3-4-7) TaxID=747676 RepID=F4S7W2_MELLP|nr:uncharacterized protein MELLADRAFT_68704 [Melampsora larici-populina 98AG31]EGF99294.1 hypothetical protein MELLADRAFT_68704 [Melampsora larici-populina 98AG31]
MLLHHSPIPLVFIALIQHHNSSLAQGSTQPKLVEQPRGSSFELTCISERSLTNVMRDTNRSCPINDEFQSFSGQGPQFRSDGLVYKFDAVTVKPIRKSPDDEKSDDLHGFVQQRCYRDEIETTNEPVCVYLNSGFNHGRGMVIVSRRSVLEGIVERIFKPESMLAKDFNRNPGSFNVIDMPEKGGKGIIASQKSHVGDLVLTTYPVLIITFEAGLWNHPQAFDLEKTMVDYLPLETRAEIATLHGEGDTEASWMVSAIQRNSFQLMLEGEPYVALFLDASRANHDCRPNVVYHTDGATLKLNMYAVREIEVGEELVAAYLNIQQPTETRRAYLRQHYGFECQCSVCSLPEHLIELSDSRLKQIGELSEALSDWTSTSIADTSMAENLLELYKLERLEIYMADAYATAAARYNSIKDCDKARIYASLASSRDIRLRGAGSEYLEDMISLRDSPEAHWTYDHRNKQDMH